MRLRLKILLGILGVVIIAFIVYLIFWGPASEASIIRPGTSSRTRPRESSRVSPRLSSSPTPSSTSSPATLLFDDFSGTLSKWQIVYTGYGSVGIENGTLSMAPMVSTQTSETHAPLIMSTNSWGDYIYTVKMNTVSQLRTGSAPNAWEVGWILFRMQDAGHSYYFVHKPNGLELGKYIPEAPYQYFLATADAPRLVLNQWNTYKIAVHGANIKVYINGALYFDYTDASPWLSGKVGLYNEDAHVHYDDVSVVQN